MIGLQQKKLKRLFVYSSIVNVGFILLGIASGSNESLQNVFIFLILYLFMSLSLWVFYISLRFNSNNRLTSYINDFSSLILTNPFLILVFILNLFSLAGIPPLIGFWTKLIIILSALDASLYFSAIFIVIVNVIGVFYYLRLVKGLYFNLNNISIYSFNAISKENSIVLSLSFLFIIYFMVNSDFIILLSYKISNVIY